MRILTSVSVALTLSLAFSAFPQGPRSQLQNMVDKLDLTADQEAKADPILGAPPPRGRGAPRERP